MDVVSTRSRARKRRATSPGATACPPKHARDAVEEGPRDRTRARHPELVLLVSLGQLAAVRDKLAAGWHPDSTRGGFSGLMAAYMRGDAAIFRLLVAHGAHLTECDYREIALQRRVADGKYRVPQIDHAVRALELIE